jgi:hypothetical protein
MPTQIDDIIFTGDVAGVSGDGPSHHLVRQILMLNYGKKSIHKLRIQSQPCILPFSLQHNPQIINNLEIKIDDWANLSNLLHDNQTPSEEIVPIYGLYQKSVLAKDCIRNKYKPMNWLIQAGCLLMAYILEIERAGKNLEFFR